MVKQILTKYEGNVEYFYKNGVFWRYGKVKTSPGLHSYKETCNIKMLRKKAIGSMNPQSKLTDQRLYDNLLSIWKWWKNIEHYKDEWPWPTKENGQSWPDANDIANVFRLLKFKGLPIGTCMAKAQIFVQIMNVCGWPKHRLAIAECEYKHNTQHMYPIYFVDGKWFYLDPQRLTLDFKPVFGSQEEYNFTIYDYLHPYEVGVYEGVNSIGVPLINK